MDSLLRLVARFAPGQGGAIWLFLLVAFILFGDTQRLRSRRNLVLLLLLLPALPMVDIMSWEDKLGDPKLGWLLEAAFSVLFAATAFMAAWALAAAFRKTPREWPVRPSESHLKLLLGFALLVNVVVVIGRAPEDAGYFTNIGARRMLEVRKLPYGDPGLRGPAAPGYGAAATYGPVLLLAHVPFQFVTFASWNDASMNPVDSAYQRPPPLATQLCCLAFHLLGLWALYGICVRLRGPPTGLAVATLYALSPYVIGLGGDEYQICGLTFISHIAPSAAVLLAILFLDRPAVAGGVLAAAAGMLYFPAFFFPLFLGWYVWRKEGAVRFLAGFAAVGAAIALFVIAFTGSIGDDGPVKLFLQCTLEHQEGTGPLEYGGSRFSFWGTHPDLAAFWQKPLFGSGSLFKLSFLVYVAFCAVSFFLARGRTVAQFALLVAALAAAIQLYKTHAGGTYVGWYLPFLLIGIFAGAGGQDERQEAAAAGPPGE